MTEKDILDLKNFGALGIENLLEPLGPAVPGASLPGYHALSTSPSRYGHPGKPFHLHETELVIAEISARMWRRYNGPIRMLTDKAGYEYIMTTPLKDAYDEILPMLDTRCCGIVPTKFWAAAKIQALSRLSVPCALFDMDMIITRPLDLSGEPVVACCHEQNSDAVYPPLSHFRTRPGYSFPAEWSEDARPLNTAFVYFGDAGLKDYYTRESFRFMIAEQETPDYWATCIVFAEQRILGMCAEARGIYAKLLWEAEPTNKLLTHFWGGKHKIKVDKELEEYFLDFGGKLLRELRGE